MCGRFTLRARPDAIAAEFGLAHVPRLEPRFNIAPTQPVAAVRLDPATGRRRLDLLRWGLVPDRAESVDALPELDYATPCWGAIIDVNAAARAAVAARDDDEGDAGESPRLVIDPPAAAGFIGPDDEPYGPTDEDWKSSCDGSRSLDGDSDSPRLKDADDVRRDRADIREFDRRHDAD
jgi:hypothetical protein